MARTTAVNGSSSSRNTKSTSAAQRRRRHDRDSDGSSSEDGSEDAMPARKQHSKGAAGKRAVDDEDAESDASEGNSDGDDDDDNEDSQNVDIGKAVNKRGSTARRGKGSHESATSTASAASSGHTHSHTHAMQPLHPLHRQQQAGSSSLPNGSPMRTVSLTHASLNNNDKRRLSGKMSLVRRQSLADGDQRRASLPSTLRKQYPGLSGDGNSSFSSERNDGRRASAHGSPAVRAIRPSGPPQQQQQQLQRRTSSGLVLHSGGIGALNAAAAIRRQASGASNGNGLEDLAAGPLPLPKISQEAMATNYEEWMKMATDNKINSSNAWSFALIDYFHDMSLLRNTDDGGSINFQKASCTLDGCVKIWTSRVDSVATETGKLLNGLSGDAVAAAEADDDDEGNDDDPDNPTGDGTQRPKKKKATRLHTATLAPSFDKIQVKDLELEFTVDPLFKKTSADFDEGGAAGLLMNHLGSDSTMRVVFDAGDAKVDDEEGEDGEQGTAKDAEKHLLVDISKLRAKFVPNLDDIHEMTICPSFSSFKFSSDPGFLDLSLLSRNGLEASTSTAPDLIDGNNRGDSVQAAGQDGPVDFFDDAPVPAFGGHDDGGMEFDNGYDGPPLFEHHGGGDDSDGEDGGVGQRFEPAAGGRHLGDMQGFDPRMAPDEREVVFGIGGDGGHREIFGYFDATVGKNWAGPEHWKMRRTMRYGQMNGTDEHKGDGDGATGKKKKTPKAPFSIDFSVESTAPDKKTLVAKSSASIVLAGSKRKRGTVKEKREDYLLPDDKHFSSQQLLRLFLKPKATINMRRRLQRTAPKEGGEIDQHYWAAAAAAQADPNAANDDDDDDMGPALPFDTQFFHDDGDDGGDYDDLPMGGDEFEGGIDNLGAPYIPDAANNNTDAADRKESQEEEELLAATQAQVKRARPPLLSYAKTSKRVDVKKLKENIWRQLAIDVVPPKNKETNDEGDDTEDDATADDTPTKEFTSVVSGLRKVYPAGMMDEISTSFCFICLLHLANEQGLRIKSDVEPTPQQGRNRKGVEDDLLLDIDSTAQFVGGLERLRISVEN